VALESNGKWPKFEPAPFRFQTATGKPIATCPAVADGCVYFGSDDGCLYGLGANGDLRPGMGKADLHRPRSTVRSPTGKTYPHPGPYGRQNNANYVDDGALRPPLRLRWAVRTGTMLKAPMCASPEDVFYLGMDGTLAAVEHETGRLRWRKRLEGRSGWLESPLWDAGRLYVPGTDGVFYCLDASDGSTRWSRPAGAPAGPFPVLCDGVVVCAAKPAGSKAPRLQALDATSGEERWHFDFGEYKEGVSVSGCVLDGVMYFSCGAMKEPGLTIAVEPRSGKVLWRDAEHHCDNRTVIAGADGRIYLTRFFGSTTWCLQATDGKLLWEKPRWSTYRAPSIGPKLMTSRSYGGGNFPGRDPETGEMLLRGKRPVLTGAPHHTCGPLTLTSGGLSLAVTVSGLHVRDLQGGEIVWSSPGFAPRACAGVVVASGRIFYHAQNGMLYCFEPATQAKAD